MSRTRDPQNTKSLRRRGTRGGLQEIVVGECVVSGRETGINSMTTGGGPVKPAGHD